MTGGEIMIIGKLLLTFGVLLGLPALELWRLRRERRHAAQSEADRVS